MTPKAKKFLLFAETRGLPQSGNLALHPSVLEDGDWQKLLSGTGAAPVVTANAGLAPNRQMQADRIVFNRGAGTATGDYSLILQAPNGASALYTTGLWAKAFSGSSYNLLIYNGSAASVGIVVLVTNKWRKFLLPAPIAAINPPLAFGTRGGTGFTAGGDQNIDILAWDGMVFLT